MQFGSSPLYPIYFRELNSRTVSTVGFKPSKTLQSLFNCYHGNKIQEILGISLPTKEENNSGISLFLHSNEDFESKSKGIKVIRVLGTLSFTENIQSKTFEVQIKFHNLAALG